MSEFPKYDLIVIGAGSAGVRAARFSASFGARVAVIEEYRPGGTCVIRGCVPKKLMVYASEVHEEMKAAKGYGWNIGERNFNWAELKERRDREVSRLSEIYLNLLKNNKVDFYQGSATLLGPNQVQVDQSLLEAEKILIAVGGEPSVPNIPGKECAWSSNEIFEAPQMPESVLIVGAGFIAVEFAGIFHGLGSKTELLVRSQFLRGFDRDCADFLKDEYQKKDIQITLGASVQKIEKKGSGHLVTLDNGETREVAQVVFATGRHPKTLELGLKEIGVELAKNGAIIVNEKFQTNIPSVYALGDCIDKVNLTPVALMQASLWARENFNQEKNKSREMSYDHLPSAVFSRPPLSSVGPSEEDLLKEGTEIEVYTSNFKPLKHTLSGIDERTFMKMIIRKSDRKVLALHMVGKDAPEIIQLGAVALKAGATKDHFDQTIGIHPSSAEEFVTMRTPRGNR